MRSPPEGRAYLGDVEVALAYADASRRVVLDAATVLMGTLFGMTPDLDSEISCVHNFIRREAHFGEELWVHRKGAISARSEVWCQGRWGRRRSMSRASDVSGLSVRALTGRAAR